MPEVAYAWQVVVGLVVDDGVFQRKDAAFVQGTCRRPRRLGLEDPSRRDRQA